MIARIRRALTRAPTTRDLWELLLTAALFAAVAAPFGLATGLFSIQAAPLREVLPAALVALVFPSLGEEVAFRAALVPDRGEDKPVVPAILGSTALFVAWHVVEAQTFLRAQQSLFSRPDFLACAALLGLACAALRRRSGSLWPAVALHWAVVVAWKAWLGGPDLRL